jgi:hypothetical protein
MNYTFDELMARLQKGDSIETIGNEFAEMLNKADAAHKAKIQENEKAKLEAANKEARMCILRDIVELLADYARYADMDLTEDDLASIDFEDFDKTIMSMLEMTKALAELKELSFPKHPVQKVAKMSNTSTMSADEALRKFIATLG